MLQQPFIEENDDRKRRPMIWKARKLDTFWAPTFTKFSAAKAEANMHWGLQIGNYMYQIHTDEGKVKYLMVQRLHGEQIWTPDVPQKILGYCNLTDTQIKKAGMVSHRTVMICVLITSFLVDDVQEQMQCSPLFRGAYDAVYNNCQSFVTMLVVNLLCDKHTEVAEGFADIADLTRRRYEHQRTSASRPYYKEVPYIVKAYPKIFFENAAFFQSHPSEIFKMYLNPMRFSRFLLDTWARIFRAGKSMRTREILTKEGIQVLLSSSLREGKEDHHVDRDDEDVKDDEHDKDDDGMNKEDKDLYALLEKILKEIQDKHQVG